MFMAEVDCQDIADALVDALKYNKAVKSVQIAPQRGHRSTT
jgi:hypothetical protein